MQPWLEVPFQILKQSKHIFFMNENCALDFFDVQNTSRLLSFAASLLTGPVSSADSWAVLSHIS